MAKMLFTNILGSFVLEDTAERSLHIIGQELFKTSADYKARENAEKKLLAHYPRTVPLPAGKIPLALALFAEKQYFPLFHDRNGELTKEALQRSVSEDDFISQTISTLKDLDKICNMLAKRLREWYDLYAPEVVRGIASHEQFVAAVLEKKKDAQSFGAALSKADVDEMRELARQLQELYALQTHQEAYLESVMQKHCPNILALAGAKIGAQLLDLAKSLKRLALLPASTIQLLGAEKALFRHMVTGSRSPKYGLLLQHPLVQKAPARERGKMARRLADKLSLCARLDYFKGELKGKAYYQELEEKLR